MSYVWKLYFSIKTVQFKYEEKYIKRKRWENYLMRKIDHHAKDEYNIQ